MATSGNIEIVKNYFDSLLTHDPDQILVTLTDDILWQVQGAPNVPTVGLFQGKDAVRNWLRVFSENFKPLSIHFDTYFENANDVVVLGGFAHLVLPTNREVDSDFAAHLVVTEGKISQYRFFEDSYALYVAFPH